MKSKILTIALVLLTGLSIKSQMNYFVMPPYALDVTSSQMTPTSIPSSSSGKYFVSNGVYDLNGNLRFYVENMTVYDPNTGAAVGTLPLMGYNFMCGEIVIVPIPGDCDKYYVIYSVLYGQMSGDAVGYIIVDCSGATPSVINNGLIKATQGTGYVLAVSKKFGTGSSAVYYLYMANDPGASGKEVSVSQITSSGIGPHNPIHTGPGGGDQSELELSENGQWLAYSDHPGGVTVIKLLNPTLMDSAHIYSYPNDNIHGLEFVGSGTPDLYVAGSNVLSWGTGVFEKIDLATSTKTAQSVLPYNFYTTFLEYTKSGRLCGISNYNGNRYLVEYNTNTAAVTATQIDVPGLNLNPTASNFLPTNTFYSGIYTLPDQIDGEDYDNFSTLPHVTLVALTVNGSSVSTNCGTWTKVYNCNEINLVPEANGGVPCNAEMIITNYNEDCEPQEGTGYFNYSGGVALNPKNGNPLFNDLRDYYQTHENSLYTKPGYYGVTYRITDCCGRESEITVYLEVLAAVPPNIPLQIKGSNSNWLTYSHNIGSPNLVGAATLGFQINGSNGSIGSVTQMNVKVDEVDNTGTTVIQNILNETRAVSPNTVISESLNQYCVPGSVWGLTPPTTSCNVNLPASYSGYKAYFSYFNTTVLGKYYKLTVTLSNPCSVSTEWTYLMVNDAYQRGIDPTITDNQGSSSGAVVYQNSQADDLKIKIFNGVQDAYTIELLDMSGRVVKLIASGLNLESGEHMIPGNTDNLQNGVYIWRISSATVNKTGMVIVSK